MENIQGLKKSILSMTSTTNEFKLEAYNSDRGLIRSFRLKNAVIPRSFYQINSTNNKLDIVLNLSPDTPYTITIPAGSYTQTNFLTTLKSVLDTATSEVWTVGVDPSTLKLSISVAGTTFQIIGTSTCLGIIGYTEDLTVNSSKVGSYPINLSPIQTVYLASRDVALNGNNVILNNEVNTNILAVIPLTSANFEYSVFVNPSDLTIPGTFNLNSQITFSFVDYLQNPIDFNTIPVNFSLEIFYEGTNTRQ